MKINLVSYIDANYLPKFLVCYKSLKKYFDNKFVMHLYCFDNVVFNIMSKYSYDDVILYKKEDFELLEVINQKKNKKSYEYYWTYTPIVVISLIFSYSSSQ